MGAGASGGTLGQLASAAVVVALIVMGIARAAAHHPTRPTDLRAARAGSAVRLEGRATSFLFHPSSGKLSARASDGSIARDLDLSLVVDGEARPLAMERVSPRLSARNVFATSFPVTVGEDSFDVLFSLRVDPATDAVVGELTVKAEEASLPHDFALRVEVPTEGRAAFVSGTGELSDLGAASGRIVEIDDDDRGRAVGIVAGHGVLDVAGLADEGHEVGTPMRLTATTAPETPTATQPAVADVRFFFAASSATLWRTAFGIAGEKTARVTGAVTGTRERARVFGLDAEGLPRVRALAGFDGRFELEVPVTVTEWYAALDPTRTSPPVQFTPGTPWDLRLDVSPGGELEVRITDGDTGKPLTARLLVHGIDGTLDPSFGPDYRASGAGPIMDALRGAVVTPLPAGRYRVAATKGIEWSIDARTVDVVSGRAVSIELAPRHVVPTPGVVGCDLHVHARPSFDSPVAPEDRVLSLASAGIDFAVPSEHNIVGDYAPSLDALDLTRELASVTGVEVTSFAPRLGHFGVFPYPVTEKVPPYRGTSINAIFKAAHRDPSRVLQVNHPRLPMGIGYFELFRFDPKKPPPPGMRTDFDTLEVYNGYDLERPLRVEAVLRDWYALLGFGHRYAATGSSDSHRIQYQWAGYPRTMAVVGEAAASPVDAAAVVSAVKKGHSFVTSGPILELDVAGGKPGDEIVTSEPTLVAHVRVRAAPWVDVTSLELVVGGRSVLTKPIASRPTSLGPEIGTRDEVESATIRFEGEVRLPVGPESTWVVAIARGDRRLDDILPFMPVSPLAFTNPVFVRRP